VLTDYTHHGKIYDVIVAADRRDEGFGAELMAALHDHPRRRALPGLSPLCRESLVSFYRRSRPSASGSYEIEEVRDEETPQASRTTCPRG
jgi:ribosomal protein S18 acetylase RimI-like enzyme